MFFAENISLLKATGKKVWKHCTCTLIDSYDDEVEGKSRAGPNVSIDIHRALVCIYVKKCLIAFPDKNYPCCQKAMSTINSLL